MPYLCTKQLIVGGVAYYPGERIPDGAILPDRSGKLIRSGYIAEMQGYVAELQEMEPGAYEGTVQISVKTASDGENEQITAIPAKPEEIRQVFSVLQMNAEEGARAIAEVASENVLILLHAADSRKTIKNAAKEQADKLFPAGGDSNESGRGNATTGTNMEGADT